MTLVKFSQITSLICSLLILLELANYDYDNYNTLCIRAKISSSSKVLPL